MHLIVLGDEGVLVLVVFSSFLGLKTGLGECFSRRVVDARAAASTATTSVDDGGGVDLLKVLFQRLRWVREVVCGCAGSVPRDERKSLLGGRAVSMGVGERGELGRDTQGAFAAVCVARPEEMGGWMRGDSQVLTRGPVGGRGWSARSR